MGGLDAALGANAVATSADARFASGTRWGSLIADIMIALGVGGEVLFGAIDSRCQSELRRRSNKRLGDALTQAGEAHERAAKLDVEAAQLRQQLAPRELSKEQYQTLLTLRDRVEAVGVTSYTDSESIGFARQIVETLRRAGIHVTLHDPRTGLAWTGIYIVVPRPLVSYESDPLYATFKSAGLSVGCGTRDHYPLMRRHSSGQLPIGLGQRALMADCVLIPLQSMGMLALTREQFDAALAAGAEFLPSSNNTAINVNEPLLDAGQVAPILGVSGRWLEVSARAGIVPHYKMGRFLRFRVSEIAVHCRTEGALRPSAT